MSTPPSKTLLDEATMVPPAYGILLVLRRGGVATCCCGGGGVVATQSIGSGVGDIAIVLDDKVDVFVS